MNGSSNGKSPYGLRGIAQDSTYHEKLGTAVENEKIKRIARRTVDSESWLPPDPGRSLAESLRDPPSPVRFVVTDLLPEGISIMAAQFKSGKTTLGIDLSACLASGADFLGYFEVDSLAGSIGYWNMEVDEPQMFEWQEKRIKKGAGHVFTAHLRGKNMDLLHPHIADWAVNWLSERNVDVWILDPLGRMLDEENDSAAFSRWFRQLEWIVAEAGVRATLIMHHSGHAALGQNDSIPRARGASSILGNSDVNIGYRHGGDLGDIPPDSRRYMSAFGRGVSVWPELTLDYEYSTGSLYVVDNAPGREFDQMEHGIDQAIEAIKEAGPWILNTTSLKEFIDGQSGYKAKVVAYAEQRGLIVSRSANRGGRVFAVPKKLGPSQDEMGPSQLLIF